MKNETHQAGAWIGWGTHLSLCGLSASFSPLSQLNYCYYIIATLTRPGQHCTLRSHIRAVGVMHTDVDEQYVQRAASVCASA